MFSFTCRLASAASSFLDPPGTRQLEARVRKDLMDCAEILAAVRGSQRSSEASDSLLLLELESGEETKSGMSAWC